MQELSSRCGEIFFGFAQSKSNVVCKLLVSELTQYCPRSALSCQHCIRAEKNAYFGEAKSHHAACELATSRLQASALSLGATFLRPLLTFSFCAETFLLASERLHLVRRSLLSAGNLSPSRFVRGASQIRRLHR